MMKTPIHEIAEAVDARIILELVRKLCGIRGAFVQGGPGRES